MKYSLILHIEKAFVPQKDFYQRTILTLFGEIIYRRKYYYNNKTNEKFYFTDYPLNLSKRKYFDRLFVLKYVMKLLL